MEKVENCSVLPSIREAIVDRVEEWINETLDIRAGNRTLSYGVNEFLPTAKALASGLRLAIIEALATGPLTMAELSVRLHIPLSTAALNVKKLTDIGLVVSELIPGTHGTQRVCALVASRVTLDLGSPQNPESNQIYIAMPVGHYVDSEVVPTCGLLSEQGIIGELDDPRSFFEPERVNAQLLWFRRGYVEYRFPMRIPPGRVATSLELTMEACSEAPLYNPDWPSDITVWVNHHELGTWTCPGDFGGEPGYLTPTWWGSHNTQFGLLKAWRTAAAGTFLDGRRLSAVTIGDLDLLSHNYISVRIGVKPGTENEGGLNLFGREFGNYAIDLEMRIDCSPRDGGRTGDEVHADREEDSRRATAE